MEEIGEPGRIRTSDQLIKSQLLYQLSYGPDRDAVDCAAEWLAENRRNHV